MNSNPFPAAFLNCKASIQVFPVSIPGGQSFIEWRIDLLTEAQHVGLMSKAMGDIMVVGLTSKSRPSSGVLSFCISMRDEKARAASVLL